MPTCGARSFRVQSPNQTDASEGDGWADETSRQANLAVNYLDAFAPVVIAALHPRTWPRVIIVDSTTLMTRGYRPVAIAVVDGGPPCGEAEQRVGNLKAGTILAALDPTGRAVVPCLLQAQGGKDVESWGAFFASLAGAPEWVVADLDAAIARAVRETWPTAILYHSRHHLAELMRGRAVADGIPERIELDEPIEGSHPIAWSPTRQTVGATVSTRSSAPSARRNGVPTSGPGSRRWSRSTLPAIGSSCAPGSRPTNC